MRARGIKPGFFKNEILGAADPINALVFEGLWCLADREGRLDDRPLRIHAEINPYRPGASTVQALSWLAEHGFIRRYHVGGIAYIQIENFTKHQQPHVKEPRSKIPPPENQLVVEEPDKPGASPVREPDKHGSGPSDSGLLIPDSGLLTADCGSPVQAPVSHGARSKPVPREAIAPPPPDDRETFEQIVMLKAKYPPGAATENWITAERAARRLVENGEATWSDLHAGVERMAANKRATGDRVMDPVRFFTHEARYWSQRWTLPKTRAQAAQSANVEAAVTWLEQNRATR